MPHVYLATLIQNFLDAELLFSRSSLPPAACDAQAARVADTRRCAEEYIATLPHESAARPLATCVAAYFAALNAFEDAKRTGEDLEYSTHRLCRAEDELQDMLYQCARPDVGRSDLPQFRRILVAIKDQPASDHALYTAIHFAESLPAALKLIHIVETPSAHPSRPGDLERMQEASRLLNQKKGEIPVGIACETLVRLGDPVHEIVSAARRWGADMIVVGIHSRRHGQSSNDIDRVAEILPLASCPVIVVGRPTACTQVTTTHPIFDADGCGCGIMPHSKTGRTRITGLTRSA